MRTRRKAARFCRESRSDAADRTGSGGGRRGRSGAAAKSRFWRRSGRFRCVAAVAAGILAASAAHAQTDDCTLSTTMTVGDATVPSRSYVGWSGLTPEFLTAATLSSTSFEANDTTYEFASVLDAPGLAGGGRTLVVTFKGDVLTDLNGWNLVGTDSLMLTFRKGLTSSFVFDPNDPDARIPEDLRERLPADAGKISGFFGQPTGFTGWSDGQTLSLALYGPSDEVESWTATMVTDEEVTEAIPQFGWRFPIDQLSPEIGAIGADEFACDGVDYYLNSILNLNDRNNLSMSLSPISGGALDGFALELDGVALPLAGNLVEASVENDFEVYGWPFTPDWRVDQSVSVSLVEYSAPPPPPPTDLQPTFGGATVADQTFEVGTPVNLQLPAASGGDGALIYSLSPAPPSSLAFNRASRTLSGTPSVASSRRTYTYTATDSDAVDPDSAELTFGITVLPAPDPAPTFGDATVANQTFAVGRPVELELPEASGGDGALTYSLSPELPGGMSFDAETRVVSGTPDAPFPTTSYVYRATDSDAVDPDSAELTFQISVEDPYDEEGLEITAVSDDDSIVVLWRGEWAEVGRGPLTVEARWPDSGTLQSGWVEVTVVPDPSAGEWTFHGLDPDVPYTFRLRSGSDYSDEVSATTGERGNPCREGDKYLCLQEGRFEVQAHWTNPDRVGDMGPGRAVRFGASDESGLFWFFDSANIELVTKVLDGRWFNDSFWVFFGALSDVEYWITVGDTSTGRGKTYHNPPKEVCGQGDILAFPEAGMEIDASSSRRAGAAARGAAGVDLLGPQDLAFPMTARASGQETGGCTPGEERLCLLDGRFAVEVKLVDPGDGLEKPGKAYSEEGTNNTGFFWFFSRENVELAVKVLDGRALNTYFWVLYGALSDVEYEVIVTDTVTGLSKSYTNEAGSVCGEVDTVAF